jgi:ribosomal protein S18 acetylase RimI-like enzyme
MPAIRPLQPDETHTLIALWTECGLVRPWNAPEEDIAFARANSNSDILVALADDLIIGSIMVGHDGHRGAVYYLAVAPARQKQGLGRMMMAAAEVWLRDRDVWKLNLLVRRDNAPVLGFYQALGYSDGHTVQLARTLDPDRAERDARLRAEHAAKS